MKKERRRWYDDACGTAHGLELIGERWALLILRELMFGPRRFGDLRASFGWIVVADPRLEQIAEHVQRIRAARFAIEKREKQRGDLRTRRIQMQVGDEKRRHGAIVIRPPGPAGRAG